jgi:DDE family transposase
MSHDTVSSVTKASGSVHEQIESFLQTVMEGLMRPHNRDAAEHRGKPGRPVSLPSVTLWMAVLVAVLRGLKSQRAIWRLLAAGSWWKQPSYDVGDQAVYKRLEQEGWKPLAQVFERVSQILARWLLPALQAYHQRYVPLASFAQEVVALDEMCLDQVSRRLPILRHLKKGDVQLLPGKLIALFDVRLQQWRTIEYVAYARENGMKRAYRMLASVKAGTTLVLADLGYFSFRWFDELTDLGYSWISRVKENTSVVVLHTYYQAGETFDRLVWLGAWNLKGKYAVRQVQFRQGGQLRQYVTNVCNPTVLPLSEIARLYARRWDIELAFLTLKRELGLHLIWSSKSVVILAQVWACLIIAQVLQAIRMEVALQADVDAFEVSLPLLIEALPQFGSQGHDGIVECVRQGRRLGIIRPSTRLRIQAPEISPEHLIPLPQETVLCRQPCYRYEKSLDKPISSGKRRSSPQIEVHPQRDRLVAILRQREAQIKALARQANAEQIPKPKVMPVKAKADHVRLSKAKVAKTPMPVALPDPSISRPPWTFLQPLGASA